MSRPLRLGIFGKGRLGQAIAAVAGTQVVWHVAREAPPPTPIDVAIEASAGAAVPERLAWALHHRVELLLGSTGFELPDLEQRIGQQIGVVVAPNFSLAMALFTQLATVFGRYAAATPGADAWLTEHHHARKADAPSGTAKQLAAALQRGLPSKRRVVVPQPGQPIGNDELSVAVTRAGSGWSRHVVGLDLPGETLELQHQARSHEPYGHGAMVAAAFVHGKRGVFTMADVLRERFGSLFQEASP